MKAIVRVFACVAALVFASAVLAQAWPARPVRMIVPFAPGGPTDVMARILAQKLSESFGHQFIVENRAGAGGNIGMGIAAKSAPDGSRSWSRAAATWSIRACTRRPATIPTRTSRR